MRKPELPGYEILEELHAGFETNIYRAIRREDGLAVILKTLWRDKAPDTVLKLNHEYDILLKFAHPGIIRVWGLEDQGGISALVLEDFGAVSLRKYLTANRIDILTFLQIGIQLVNALEEIHRHNIIHKDINPSNIVLNPDNGRVKIIDFGIASILQQEMTGAANPDFLEGTLQYISPEQSGRMNRIIDYRSDFYSLGISLYEMLIGWAPFQSDDPLELIHHHLTRTPKAPSELNREIPPVVSQIITRLLSKTPEQRYQSAYGLKNDLEICLQSWQQQKSIPDFRPGEKDISDKFQLPQKLYGREECLEEMLEAYQRCSAGATELLLLNGQAGIGKSSLINELKKTIRPENSIFISGKYDRVKQDVPYLALSQAFQELVRQLMALPETELAGWRERVLEALGANAGVIIEAIPGMEVILGEQPPAPPLPTVESQNRLNSAFQKFMEVLARPDRPLIISLDDLQWADAASLRSVQLLLTNPELHHFMIITAARDNELDPGDPALNMINEIEEAGVMVTQISVTPLTAPVIARLISDALHCGIEDAMALATLVHHKTEGNPYFVSEFLKYLDQEKVIRFDSAVRRWGWDLAEIQRTGVTDNVVHLMAEKIQKLPTPAIQMLACAACIGNQFELNLLALANGKTPVKAAGELWEAIQAGLIIPVGEGYKFIPGANSGDEKMIYQLPADYSEVGYKFSHDRVHQAAYSLIAEDQKTDFHLEIGYSLLRQSRPHRVEERIFDIVNQLNMGRSVIGDAEKRIELAGLNLLAGKKAKASIALEAAYNYLLIGTKLLDYTDWEANYELSMELHNELGECEYLSGNFENAEKRFDLNIRRARSNVEKAALYRRKVELYVHTSHYDKAVSEGILGLQLVGEKISAHPNKLTVFLELAKSRLRVGRKKIDSLISLPDMTDQGKMAALEILMNFSTIGYSASPEFHGLLTARKVNITLKHGMADVSSYAFAVYGLLIGAGFGAYGPGVEFGKLAITICEQRNNHFYMGRANFVMAAVLNHWKNHARSNLDYLSAAVKYCSESADFLNLSYARIHIIVTSFYLGLPLSPLSEQLNEFIHFSRKIKYDDIRLMYVGYRQLILNLLGQTRERTTFDSEDFSERDFMKELDATEFTVAKMYYYHHKVISNYLWANYREALQVVEASRSWTFTLSNQLLEADFSFYSALAVLALQRQAPHREYRRYKPLLSRHLKKLKRWAGHCPENFQAKYLLLTAEIARNGQQFQRAMDLYDEAIRSARENEFVNTSALAGELAAGFYREQRRDHIAQIYLKNALQGYGQWGAMAKVQQLEEEFSGLLSQEGAVVSKARVTKTDNSTELPAASMDYISILKASQAFSGEIIYEKVLKNMMNIVMENAGAERGFFIVERDGRYIIAAAVSTREEQIPAILQLPLDESDRLAKTIVHYVARSGESVVLNDASREGDFTADPYIRQFTPKSVLCAPIIHQGKLAGILYLENNLVTGAFTPQRLEVLGLLSSQIAISIENAQLHQQEKDLILIQEEVRLAARIQQDLLPKSTPRIPGYEIEGLNIPAQLVGGDYYDFISITDNKVALCVGDVSGKGLPASLLMANLQATLRAQAFSLDSPGTCMERSNKLLVHSTGEDKFITLFYGILDFEHHEFCYSNAGHDAAYFVNTESQIQRLEACSIVLGMLENITYEQRVISFNPGDVLVIYSDGIPEAMNERHQEYGDKRLEAIILKNLRATPAEIITRIIDDVRAHARGVPQSDDITLMVIKRLSE